MQKMLPLLMNQYSETCWKGSKKCRFQGGESGLKSIVFKRLYNITKQGRIMLVCPCRRC